MLVVSSPDVKILYLYLLLSSLLRNPDKKCLLVIGVNKDLLISMELEVDTVAKVDNGHDKL